MYIEYSTDTATYMMDINSGHPVPSSEYHSFNGCNAAYSAVNTDINTGYGQHLKPNHCESKLLYKSSMKYI